MMLEPGTELTGTSRHSKFLQACNNYQEYPACLLIPSLSSDIRDDYQKVLEEHSRRLLDETCSRILLREFWDGDEEFDEIDIDDPHELEDHLQERSEKDLKYRHVVIHSTHSRSRLNCSVGLLKKLLTFHQVAPFILDDLTTFGIQGEQLDASLARFTDHNAYYMDLCPFPLPPLGRSGYELRHSFLLRSAELGNPEDKDPWRWRIRPCAVYHSFDLVTGKTFWITTTASDLIQKKITTHNPPGLSDSNPSTTSSTTGDVDIHILLGATLATHLIYFHWCESSWRWFIRDLDRVLTQKTDKAREIPLGRRPYETTLPVRRDTGLSSPTTPVFPSSSQDQPKGVFISSLKRIMSFTKSPLSSDVLEAACKEKTGSRDSTYDEAYVLGKFTFRDLQSLGTIYRRLEEARRTCELNRQVLNDICHYYSKSAQYYPPDMDPETEMAISKTISQFVGKVEAITKGLERSEKQLASLRTIVAETDIPLMESILQLRDSYANRVFAEAAHGLSTLMQNIATRTANISSSGFIVAFIVFIPLCATFTTGLLQSPIYECQAGTNSCQVNHFALKLFGAIAGPLTLLAIVIFWCLNRRAHKRVKQECDNV